MQNFSLGNNTIHTSPSADPDQKKQLIPLFLQTVAFPLHGMEHLITVTPSKQPLTGEHHETI